jgi:hypothetical protein
MRYHICHQQSHALWGRLRGNRSIDFDEVRTRRGHCERHHRRDNPALGESEIRMHQAIEIVGGFLELRDSNAFFRELTFRSQEYNGRKFSILVRLPRGRWRLQKIGHVNVTIASQIGLIRLVDNTGNRDF